MLSHHISSYLISESSAHHIRSILSLDTSIQPPLYGVPPSPPPPLLIHRTHHKSSTVIRKGKPAQPDRETYQHNTSFSPYSPHPPRFRPPASAPPFHPSLISPMNSWLSPAPFPYSNSVIWYGSLLLCRHVIPSRATT